MTDLRQAAQAALEALEATQRGHWPDDAAEVIDDLRAALAAQPVAFDHDIGADRYQVVKGSFWWHVRIGDSTANVGKFHTKMAAEDMALKLLTAFRDGAFMQSRAAQPVAWGQLGMLNGKTYLRMNYDRTPYPPPADVVRNLNLVPLFAAAQPQQAISAPAQIDLSNEWPTTRYFVKQVMARFGTGPNENIASALRKLYAEAPAQPQQASPHSSST